VLLPPKGVSRNSLGVNFPYLFGDESQDIASKIPKIYVAGFDAINVYNLGKTGKIFVFHVKVRLTTGLHSFIFISNTSAGGRRWRRH
jgi:hypothetical protein